MKMTDRKFSFLSRRTLLGGVAAAGTLAAIVMVDNGGIVGRPGALTGSVFGGRAESALARAEASEWLAVVGTNFRIAAGLSARLVGVEPMASAGARPRGLRQRAFKAVFELPAFTALPGNLVYTLSSSAHGALDLYLSEGSGRFANRLYAILN
jgi:hypothetical protein